MLTRSNTLERSKSKRDVGEWQVILTLGKTDFSIALSLKTALDSEYEFYKMHKQKYETENLRILQTAIVMCRFGDASNLQATVYNVR